MMDDGFVCSFQALILLRFFVFKDTPKFLLHSLTVYVLISAE